MANIQSINSNPIVAEGSVQAFETVAGMQASEALQEGMVAHTNGFHTSGDGGAAYYTISASGTANGMDVLALQGGLFATLVVTEHYVTPEQFGAWGDGTHDDAPVLSYLIKEGYSVELANSYYIESSLYTGTSSSTDKIHLKLHGHTIHDIWYDASVIPSKIIVADGVTAFSTAVVLGAIDGVAFIGENPAGQTSNTVCHLFSKCTIRGLKFRHNFVYNFEDVFLNCAVTTVSTISDNVFLSCYYFAKCNDGTYYAFGDSVLENNYINGGTKYNDASCFQWHSFPASRISDNFVDFYCVIFDPSGNGTLSNVTCVVNASGNRWEVFRYFLSRVNVAAYCATFVGDIFQNITGGAAEATINAYTKQVLAVSGTDYELEPYLVFAASSRNKYYNVVFEDVCFGLYAPAYPINATGQAPLAASMGCKFVLHVNHASATDTIISIVHDQSGNSTYYGNNTDGVFDSNFIHQLSAEPAFTSGYAQPYVQGCLYSYNGIVYRCVKYRDGTAWKLGLVDNLGTLAYHN